MMFCLAQFAFLWQMADQGQNGIKIEIILKKMENLQTGILKNKNHTNLVTNHNLMAHWTNNFHLHNLK